MLCHRRFLQLFIAFCLLLGCASSHAEKVLRLFLTGGESGLDPATASDLSSLSLNENIFDALLRYDYLARPVKLQANTAALPLIDAQQLNYTFRLRPGIWFSPDPAFKGQRRELIAQDYVYSIKRLYDPVLKSPWLFMFEGKLSGDGALRMSARNGKFDIDTPIDGLQVVDRYTLRIRLQAPEPNLLFYLATGATAAVAREVVEAYPQQAGNHPVGTGPFRVGLWQRSHQIQLLANPDYHGSESTAQASTRQRLPRVDKIDIKIMEEAQARVLSFLNGEFDYLEQLPPALNHLVLQDDQLRPKLRELQLHRFVPLQTYYMWMNMEDPVLGGFALEKIALRRAIAMSYHRTEDLRVQEQGLAVAAESPLPPGVIGFNPKYRGPQAYNPALACALLDRFGYTKRDADGFRRLPNGQNLTLTMHTLATTEGRLRDEVWRKSLSEIGLRVVFKGDKKSEIIKSSRLGRVQMFETNWIADFPDGENFLQLLYGPNRGRANYARFNLPAFDQRYERARKLPPGPERQRLYDEMAQLVHVYAPWVLRMHPVSLDLVQPWVKNYLRHPVELTNWRYLDVDLDRKP